MKRILANLSVRQRISIAVMAVVVLAGLWGMVRWQREADFKPLFTGVCARGRRRPSFRSSRKRAWSTGSPRPAGRCWCPPPNWRNCASKWRPPGCPRPDASASSCSTKPISGPPNSPSTSTTAARSKASWNARSCRWPKWRQARVHVTFPKDSVFLESQQPAKASVLVKLRPGKRLAPPTFWRSTTWWPAPWKGCRRTRSRSWT